MRNLGPRGKRRRPIITPEISVETHDCTWPMPAFSHSLWNRSHKHGTRSHCGIKHHTTAITTTTIIIISMTGLPRAGNWDTTTRGFCGGGKISHSKIITRATSSGSCRVEIKSGPVIAERDLWGTGNPRRVHGTHHGPLERSTHCWRGLYHRKHVVAWTAHCFDSFNLWTYSCSVRGLTQTELFIFFLPQTAALPRITLHLLDYVETACSALLFSSAQLCSFPTKAVPPQLTHRQTETHRGMEHAFDSLSWVFVRPFVRSSVSQWLNLSHTYESTCTAQIRFRELHSPSFGWHER